MSRKIIEGTLAAAVANAGTVLIGYPTGFDCGSFSQGYGHKLVMNGQVLSRPADIGLSFAEAGVTVTNRTGATWASGSQFYLQLERPGDNPVRFDGVDMYTEVPLVYINLGSPLTLDADGICASQTTGAAGNLLINGALASGGAVTLDAPRNVIVDSGGADDAVITVTGTDVFGNAMVEQITMNGTTAVAGKKAFKTITTVHGSKAVANGGFVGTGDVLGLPVRVPSAGYIVKEHLDGAAATAGTFVGGLSKDTESTATTADVRGTYLPNSACDGDRSFALICALPDPSDIGNPQFAG